MSEVTDEIERELRLVSEAMGMIEREDLCHWSHAHDRVTLAALHEARRALLIEREEGMRQQDLLLGLAGGSHAP